MANSSHDIMEGTGMAGPVKDYCAACGTHKRRTPRFWKCVVCPTFLLCENCHNASDDSNDASHYHHLAPYVSICECCESSPIFNRRWRCEVCEDYDLCEVCYLGVDDAEMPGEHSKEHLVTSVEVIPDPKQKLRQPNFAKPVSPQWAYKVDELGMPMFKWVQRQHLADTLVRTVEDYRAMHTTATTSKKEMNSLSSREETENTSTTRSVDKQWKIFLSHAGAQKDFVERLHVDLQSIHHWGVFFDKDDESLPKGERFPQHIFKAGRECQLAVVVMSDEYFSRKWPMLELATFVEAQKTRPELKILPIFYKLSLEQFKQSNRQQLYIKSWKRFATKKEISQWKEALHVIPSYNGIHFLPEMGELKLLEEIVKAICKRVPPDFMWDDSHVQGKERMNKTIKESFQRRSQAPGNARSTSFLGLYGMGGSGKTTLTKVFCNNMMQSFLGKVYHIELGSRDPLTLCKELLQCMSISKFSEDFLKYQVSNLGKALKLLREHLPGKKIYLVIDNVSDNQASIEEARAYLTLPFVGESLVLITARSINILKILRISADGCQKVPTLKKHEAIALFTYHAGCDISRLSEGQRNALETFVEQCCFKVEDMSILEYHPLALKVLGTRVGHNAEDWQNLDFKHCSNENIHPIFSILQTGYDALRPQYHVHIAIPKYILIWYCDMYMVKEMRIFY